MPRPFTIFIVVGEESGDQLGSKLMVALRELYPGPITFIGTGGSRMEALGLTPLLRPGEIDIIGISQVLFRFRHIFRRIREIAAAAIAAEPDLVVLVDSPEFSHRVGKIVRRERPQIPIVNYVSPTVWAWRSSRAPKMVPYIDHVLALLPFEPQIYVELKGPPCTYVGHPLLEKVSVLRPAPGERPALESVDRPTLLILPGSRTAEVKRLMEPFGEALARITREIGPVEAVLPAVPHLSGHIRERLKSWPVQPTVVEGEAAKYHAFRRAHAALAASGTVSLELALAGVPTVIAYRVEAILRPFKWMLRVPSVVLSNVVLGERIVPEFLDGKSRPERLAAEVVKLLRPGTARERQLAAFSRLDSVMAFDGDAPSRRAAQMVLDVARKRGVLPPALITAGEESGTAPPPAPREH
ncbi:MAG: lipid-A-disaccharide synthase [Bauldia sp.]|nr:lipid-A-disaccharide synthase [Bauldia sp.]